MSPGVWVITGASRGIGEAIALGIAGPDRAMVLTATRAQNLESVADRLRAVGSAVRCAEVNLEEPDAAEMALEAALGSDRVAGVVNNAGILERGRLASLSRSQIERLVRVNLLGLIQVTQIALRRMERGARILNVGSISGTLGSPEGSVYNATKWAVTGLTRSWGEELREQGIFVAELRPGSVATRMLAQTPFTPRVPAEEVGRVARFLALEAPMSMTGSSVDIFG